MGEVPHSPLASFTRPLTRNPAALVFFALFLVVAVWHLAVQALGSEEWASLTQVLLIPPLALAFWLAAQVKSRLVVFTLIALVFSWFGDTLPSLAPGDLAFLVMVGFFLLAQISYISAFNTVWAKRSDASRRAAGPSPRFLWFATAGYACAIIVLVVLCAAGAGSLLVPVIVYGLCLAAMAIASIRVNAVAAVGGLLFFCSDSMIALDAFADLHAGGFAIMLTYIAGQALLVVGVLRRASA
jgi:uncharacterized membrane protein YhhN